jgi:Zn-dependent protease with chaperone function
MKARTRHLLLFSLLFVLLSFSAGAQAPAEEQDKSGKKPKEEKEKKGSPLGKVTGVFSKSDAEKAEKAEKNAVKREQEYQKFRENGQKKYDVDPMFKIRVDEDYKAVRRRHSDYAFQINTFDVKDERTTFSGDKLKTEDSLYDNPLVQDYVNRVGQALVPDASPHRYAFKVVLNPVPDARSLSTGTVYITTGLLSIVDNEAQLSYLLAHEISHIEKRHWFQDSLVANEMEDYNRAQERKQEMVGLGAALAGGVIGGIAGGSVNSALKYGFLSGLGAYVLMKFIAPTKVFAWDRLQENEADEYGLKLMFDRNYDPREVPKLYARLKKFSEREPRTADGFLAQIDRVGERAAYFNGVLPGMVVKPNLTRGSSNLRSRRESTDGDLISPLEVGKAFGTSEEADKREKTAVKQVAAFDAVMKDKLEKGEIIGSAPEFDSVMADLKRDNGVRAFYYDMFQMALENLREALQLRSNDPYTYFYYGKVLNLTARSRAEKAEAMNAFLKTIELDQRGVLSGPWLQRALALMADRNPSQSREIVNYLARYVDVYQQEHSGELPPNMDAIYAYMKDLGEDRWVARPAMNVSTKNIEPIDTAAGSRGGVSQAAPVSQPASQPSTQPASTKGRKP